VQDKCTWYEQALLIAGGLCMIVPGLITDTFGLVALGFVIFMQKKRVRVAQV
jgi:UPF0716 family protein affecting phage T7 exclusion